MTPHDIDHLVVAVHDMAAARETYRRLGFTLTPVARHPFGTENTLALVEGAYIELIAVADPAAIPEPTGERFSFGGFQRDFLAHREGLSMVALQSTDTAADTARFAAGGLPTYEPMSFEREAVDPEGQPRTVRFSLAYTSDARTHGAAGFFACHQHARENLWRPEYQRHANGARSIDSAVFVTRDHADFHEFFTHFTGQHDMLSTSLHVKFSLGRSAIDIMSPVGFHAFFGEDARADPRRFTAMRIAVSDLRGARTVLTQNEVPFQKIAEAIVVPASAAHGVAIAFLEIGPR